MDQANLKMWREIINKRQEVQLQQFRSQIAEATAKSEEARKGIAEADARAAEANQLAEQERLARLKIEEKLAPRHLSAEQQEQISGKLRSFKGQRLNLFAYADDPEALRLGNEIIVALGSCGTPG